MARLAGLPDSVLRRADVFARRIEAEHDRRMLTRGGSGTPAGLSLGQLALLRQLNTALSGMAKIGHGNGTQLNLMQLWHESQSVSC